MEPGSIVRGCGILSPIPKLWHFRGTQLYSPARRSPLEHPGDLLRANALGREAKAHVGLGVVDGGHDASVVNDAAVAVADGGIGREARRHGDIAAAGGQPSVVGDPSIDDAPLQRRL